MDPVHLQPGDQAPSFCLSDRNGEAVCLSDLKGDKVLLYFYPKASTPGCTVQSCSVRDARAHLASLGVKVLGVSPDPAAAQKRFSESHRLDFPLLSDPDHAVATAYGVWGEKSMYGKKYPGIIRSSFLIDGEGKILQAWYKVSPKDTVPEALKALSG